MQQDALGCQTLVPSRAGEALQLPFNSLRGEFNLWDQCFTLWMPCITFDWPQSRPAAASLPLPPCSMLAALQQRSTLGAIAKLVRARTPGCCLRRSPHQTQSSNIETKQQLSTWRRQQSRIRREIAQLRLVGFCDLGAAGWEIANRKPMRLQDPAAARKEIANLKAMGSPDPGAVPIARKPRVREVRLLVPAAPLLQTGRLWAKFQDCGLVLPGRGGSTASGSRFLAALLPGLEGHGLQVRDFCSCSSQVQRSRVRWVLRTQFQLQGSLRAVSAASQLQTAEKSASWQVPAVLLLQTAKHSGGGWCWFGDGGGIDVWCFGWRSS